MKDWGFGLIGCGAIAGIHLEALSELEHANICAVCSRRAKRAREAAQRYGCDWTTSYQELLSRPDIDIVCVTTDSGSHARIGLDVLRAGKHLVLEKPLAMNSKDASALIEMAKARGVMLSVISQTRFMKHHRIVKQVLEEGKIGRLLLIEVSRPFYRTQEYYDSIDWRGTFEHDGGALMNQGIHSIDLMLWLAGKVATISGKVATQTHRMEAEDIGTAMVTFENGAVGSVMCSTSMMPGFPPELRVHGELGAIHIEGPRIVHWSVPGCEEPILPQVTNGTGASDPMGIPYIYHKQQLEDVICAVEEGRKPAVTGEEARNAIKFIELIYESSSNNSKAYEFSDSPSP